MIVLSKKLKNSFYHTFGKRIIAKCKNQLEYISAKIYILPDI